MNLSFIDGVSDEAFLLLQYPSLYSNSLPLPYGGVGGSRISSTGSTTGAITTSSAVVTHPRGTYSTFSISSSPLQKLNLGNSNITDTSMFRMKFLSELTEIGLSWCSGITDQGIIALSTCCPKLQYIDLKSCQITDVAINAIARNCNYLTRLDVSGCMLVSDEGFENLVQNIISQNEAGNIPSRIRSVSIDNSYKAIAKSRGLTSLNIVWCSQLTDTTLAALRKLATLGTYLYQGGFTITMS